MVPQTPVAIGHSQLKTQFSNTKDLRCWNTLGFSSSWFDNKDSLTGEEEHSFSFPAFTLGSLLSPEDADTAKLEIRLVDGPNRCSGRVEVLHKDVWGTVCDDLWDLREARVVCRQLGCGTAVSAPWNSKYGEGKGQIWLSDVNCTGTEASLTECEAKPWGDNICNHVEDASVECSGNPSSIPHPAHTGW